MVVFGVVAWLVLSVLAVVFLGAFVSMLSGGAVWAAAGAVLFACFIVPVLLDRRLTNAFRRMEPGARGTLDQSLALVNGAWLAVLVLAVPRLTRTALDERGVWFLPAAVRTEVQPFVSRLAARIPRSARSLAEAAPDPSSAPSGPSASAPVASSPVPSTPTKASPVPSASVGPAIRPPESAVDDDTPAARVFRERSASVVVIRTREPVAKGSPLATIFERLGIDFSEGLGSGFVVEAAGVIVTNHHVLGTAQSLDVALQDGRHFPVVTVLRDDEQNDLALLSIPAKDLPVVPLSTKEPKVGSRAIAIGSPLGLDFTLTEGIVSAFRKADGTRFLQMQTSIAPGSSGGPLFNDRGELIGVNTASEGSSLNMAVYVAHVRDLLAAPREPRALMPFERGPEVRAIEPVGGAIDPTSRLNFRSPGELLAHVAQRCATSLPPDARFTQRFRKDGMPLDRRIDSNLGDDVTACLSTNAALVSIQIGLLLSRVRSEGSSATGVDVVVTGLAPNDPSPTTGGELRFRFTVEP